MIRIRETVRVLVVDDDPMLRMLAAKALANDGYEVAEAADGVEALAKFQSERPDIVVLDVVMPGMDGYEVCAELRAKIAGASVPILMTTSLDDVDAVKRAYESGATDFITKPINYALLVHRLRYLMRASTAFGEARQSTARLERAQRLAGIAQWELELETGRFRWSDEAEVIYGIPLRASDVAGALLRWVHPADRASVARVIAQEEAHTIEYRMVLPDGRTRIIHQEADVVVDPLSRRMVLEAAAQDITERRDAEKQMHHLAYHDALTGLPNRTLLRRRLVDAIESARASGRSVATLMLDLDGFKRVNDTLGHAGGDELLCAVAERLAACLGSEVRGRSRSNSVRPPRGSLRPGQGERFVVSRLGGDEFVVALTDIESPEEASEVALLIADQLASVHRIGGNDVFVSSSVGIAIYPSDASDVDTLLERADAAMYHAKQAGRNRSQRYTPAMEEEARTRIELETRLRRALAQAGIAGDDGATGENEFQLFYQPKIAVPGGAFVGVEALLRWTSREHGPTSPAAFVPVAEETGLIVPLGAWVLREACTQGKRWLDAGQQVRVAVNVSARQFCEPGFVALVSKVLADTALPPTLLELEITEGMVMQDTGTSKKLLGELKALGVRIALDDFGTGYSSLSYLTRFPIDTVKIDRSFVAALGKNPEGGMRDAKGATIVSAIIALSQSLLIDVVVEGVETAEQLAFIEAQGGAEVQGYYFAKPMPAGQLPAWRAEYDEKKSRRPSFEPRPRAVRAA